MICFINAFKITFKKVFRSTWVWIWCLGHKMSLWAFIDGWNFNEILRLCFVYYPYVELYSVISEHSPPYCTLALHKWPRMITRRDEHGETEALFGGADGFIDYYSCMSVSQMLDAATQFSSLVIPRFGSCWCLVVIFSPAVFESVRVAGPSFFGGRWRIQTHFNHSVLKIHC